MDGLKWLEDMKKTEESARKKLPEALSKQKKKFLIGIKKCNEVFSKEDEEFVKQVMHDLHQWSITSPIGRGESRPWNDSFADDYVKLEENAHFDLNMYLDCARLVFLTYSGLSERGACDAAKYVLRHARQFGDMSKPIFPINTDSETNNNISVISSSTPLPKSKFMLKIEQLISDLRSEYDENKFRILNTNATYITLLMLRRVVKSEAECVAAFKRIHTHDSYVKLCPSPLDNQLPKYDTRKLYEFTLKTCAYLAIQAYLDTDDERTKKALRVTCVQYMEWNGLQLPKLFFQVVELYDIDEEKLWDLLCVNKASESLMRFANEYYEKYEILKDDPTKTQRWFPYCRIFSSYYHKNLSAPQNVVICLILAYLVDLKIGFDKSTVRLSHWTKSARLWQNACQKYAEKIYEDLLISS